MNKPRENSPARQDLIDSITKGASDLGIVLPDEAPQRMLNYLQELQSWNQHHNLTAIDNLDKMVTHHLLDCLSILPFIRSDCVCDIGSGAGLPGIALALAQPGLQVTLVESRAKKVSFLLHVLNKIETTNVITEQIRVEDFKPDAQFDTITARALAPLDKLFSLCRHLVKPGGCILAMKSSNVEKELAQLSAAEQAGCRLEQLAVPGVNARRCVVILEC
ncbi:MAG: 16S rRNA (guanine(527)-N(7))-methyltransferase RsmG [Gammaproteobacteria bacterium]|nr:16S rRNA (guanine(527)-N(7))-methyltransferase RsmG [Gammaproteobacteria bacterium]